MSLGFTGERIVPGAPDCEPTFARKMYQEHLARYAFAAQFAPGADVLDVGCGVGYGSQWLAKGGARSVHGFDISAEAIEHARMHYFHPAVTYKAMDATRIERGEGYDLVTCFELIEHIAQQEKVLDLIKAALREDGILAISTPRPLDEMRTHFHVHEMNFEELHGLLKGRFKYVEAYFEVNCFTSFVGKAQPEAIDRIVPVSDRVSMDHADYFVFLASDVPLDAAKTIGPVLTMNDDSYVLNLEKDVGILRQAENDHLARIAMLQQERDSITQSHAEAVRNAQALSDIVVRTDSIRDSLDKVNAQLSNQIAQMLESQSLRDRIGLLGQDLASRDSQVADERTAAEALRREVDRLNGDLAVQYSEAECFEARYEALQEQFDAARRDADELRGLLLACQNRMADREGSHHAALASLGEQKEALARNLQQLQADMAGRDAELATVRHAIADSSARLAAAETDLHNLRGAAERLPEALERASSLEAELVALRYRLDYSERTLARFRKSFSWTITKPLRWVWRNSRKMTGRSLPQ